MDIFTGELYKWYRKNKRDLPWRNTSDPYLIWISEIMLQQTRVIQATDYYYRFVNKFPTVHQLAAAREDDVLKLWQGLGYYSRARNMHETARKIANELNGKFPEEYQKLIKLKGIGNYTAAAIASIAFNQQYAAVDGNVSRVLSRYFGITSPVDSEPGNKEIRGIADALIDKSHAGIHNQAMMEFGALQCIPKNPDCISCPVVESCYAFKNGLTKTLPVKTKKNPVISRYFYYYIIIVSKNNVILEKRTGDDIWKNLFQFPLVESKYNLSDEEIFIQNPEGIEISGKTIRSITSVKKHQLTHQTIFARFILLEAGIVKMNSGFIQADINHISNFAIPKLLEEQVLNLLKMKNEN